MPSLTQQEVRERALDVVWDWSGLPLLLDDDRFFQGEPDPMDCADLADLGVAIEERFKSDFPDFSIPTDEPAKWRSPGDVLTTVSRLLRV